MTIYNQRTHDGSKQSVKRWNHAFIVLVVCVCAGLLIAIIAGQNHSRIDNSKMQINTSLTDLLYDDIALPKNVSSLHCWIENEGNSTLAKCEASLSGRSVEDMGKNTIKWADVIYANPNEPGHPTHGFVRDTASMVHSKFNFMIQRNDNGLNVLSNVDTEKVSFDEAGSIIKAIVTVFNQSSEKQLRTAQENAPDNLRATWPDTVLK